MTTPLSNKTPMTTALAIALCAGAFWCGRMSEAFHLRMTAAETRIDAVEQQSLKTADVLLRLSELSRELQTRLDHLERARNQ